MGTSAWCALIITTSVICVLSEFFIPPGKIGKTFNVVLSLFILGAIIDFVQNQAKNNNFKTFKSDKITLQNQNKSFTNKIESQTEALINQSLEAIIRDNLKDLKINPQKIEIFTDKNEDNCIVLIRCKIYIQTQQTRFAVKAKELLEKNLKISAEFIEI